MKTLRPTPFLLALLAALSIGSPAMAMDAVVPTDFATVGAAITGATDVDGNGLVEILVMDGTYDENLFIGRPDLVLAGASNTGTILRGVGALDTVRVEAAGVTVRNFTITGDGSAGGVGLRGATGCRVEQNVLHGNRTAITVRGGDTNTVTGNDIHDNRNGIKVRESSGNTVTMNTVQNQERNGIVVRQAPMNTVEMNVVANSLGTGFKLREASGSTAAGNTVSGSGRHGIRVRESAGLLLSGNTSSANGGDGLRMRDTQGTLVTLNNLTGNAGYGVRRRDWVDDDFDASAPGFEDPPGDNDLSGNTLGDLRED